MSTTCSSVPGEKPHLKTELMGMAQGVVQSFVPTSNICQHVCGIHCYDGQQGRQLIAHHYCSHLTEDVRQCVIYDSPNKDARLIGVEYIISAKLFAQLPEDERKYWHSHAYEVKSGLLVAPGLPEMVEHKDMAHLVDTYGKTWHLWQVDRGDRLPMGPANLMMALTGDGQANAALLAQKDELTQISTDQRRQDRANIPMPMLIAGADQGLGNECSGQQQPNNLGYKSKEKIVG